MTIYHVDNYYDNADKMCYAVYPYSLKGVLKTHFGFNFREFKWIIRYYPWYLRFTNFFFFLKRIRFTEQSANKLMGRLNRIQENKRSCKRDET